MPGPDVTLTMVQAPAQTSASCYAEVREGQRRSDKSIDTEQSLGLRVGAWVSRAHTHGIPPPIVRCMTAAAGTGYEVNKSNRNSLDKRETYVLPRSVLRWLAAVLV